MLTENLSYKRIQDFTTDDTIYIKIREGAQHTITLLCQFVKLEKGRVTGKVLSATTNPTLYTHKIAQGWEVSADLSRCALYGKTEDEDHPSYHWFDPIGYAAHESAEQRHLRVPKDHESYGLITISRTHGHPKPLFGSSILHTDRVSIRISEAELHRSLYEDRIHQKREIIEVELSTQQFADMLTSPNTSGTPVTIRHINYEKKEDTPFVSKLDQFQSEYSQKIENITRELTQTVQNAKEILSNPKAPTKKERDLILQGLDTLVQELKRNLPFLASQFQEQMERTLGEAKAAFQTFAEQKAKSLGISTLESDLPKLVAETSDHA
jgi:hypothetical protein